MKRMYVVMLGLAAMVGAWGQGQGAPPQDVPPPSPQPAVRQHVEPSPPTALPQLSGTVLTVPWREFKDLLEQIRPPEKRKEEAPPYEWTVSKAEYEAEVLGENTLHVEARIEISVLKDKGWVSVPVLGSSVALAWAKLDGEDVPLSEGGEDGFLAVIREPGLHTLTAEFYVHCEANEGVVSFEFPCPRTPVTRMKLGIPVRDAVVNCPTAANIEVRREEKGLKAELAFRSTKVISANWTLPAVLAKQKEAARPVEKPRVACMTSTLAAITDRFVTCESRIRYELLRGATDAFTLKLPAAVNVLQVVGQGSAWTRTEEGEQQTIEVKLNHSVSDNYDLAISYEAPFDDEAAMLRVPELLAQDVVRETGFIGVTAISNVEVAQGAEVEGLKRVDITELPTAVRSMSRNPLLLGYKYTDGSYLLALDVRKLEDVPVRVANIDSASLTSVVTQEGMIVSRATYQVRNNVKQFLRVSIGEKAEVWGAEVGGQVVKPARDGESGAILIPLFKSVATNRSLGTFPVSLTYMERLEGDEGVPSKLDLTAPATDILANSVAWEVLLPEKRRVYRTTGDFEPFGGQDGGGRDSRRMPTARTQRETIRRMREGIERFMITDINNPAASAFAQNGPRARFPEAEDGVPAMNAAPSDTAIAGVLPIRVDLPLEGVGHHFRRTLAPQGKALDLTIYTYSSGWVSAAWLCTLLLAIAVGLAAGHLVYRRITGGGLNIKWVAGAIVGLAVLVAIDVTTAWSFWRLYALCAACAAGGAVLPRLLAASGETSESVAQPESDGE